VLGAAGNLPFTPQSTVAFPAKFANCMAVSATNAADLFADSFSHYGPEIDVSAPGDSIRSTSNSSGYLYITGTSMATPHVTGLAALIKSYIPGVSLADLRNIITSTADDKTIDPDDPLGPPLVGFDILYGHGRINAHSALLAAGALSVRVVTSTPTEGSIEGKQPSDPDGGNVTGIQNVVFEFDGDASSLLTTEFSVIIDPENAAPEGRNVVDVIPNVNDDNEVTLVLDAPIPPGAWTTITHDFTGTGVRLGYLPGDVNENGVADAEDITYLIDVLNGLISQRIRFDIDQIGRASCRERV